MSNFLPTPEQQAALDAFATGENMVIQAGAGTGKTSTLRLLAESTSKSGLYLAYNKAIQLDAAKDFPESCQCKTAHSLAYGGVIRMPNGKSLLNRLRAPRVTSKQAVSILGIPSGGFQISNDQNLAAWIIARAAMDTVKNFCNSADTEVDKKHVAKIDGVEDHASLASYVAPFAAKAWADLNNKDGQLKFDHDHYLKIWALSNPKLNADYILFDEAQDANPVIVGILKNQDAQLVAVGDEAQAIYGWRGAVDAMHAFDAKHRVTLSQSFRFGPAVAEQANKYLDLLDAPLRLSGFDKVNSTVEILSDPDAILCRTNAAVFEYAMNFQADGKKVAIVGGATEIKNFAFGALALMKGETTSHPDLSAFANWAEVNEYVGSDEGKDLKVMVNMVNMYGVGAILDVCNNSVDESSADLIVSTAHKSKGREWNKVRIGRDFKAPESGVPSRQDLMLLYVSVTRAKIVLDASALSWVDDLS
jgi:hypothetical protein